MAAANCKAGKAPAGEIPMFFEMMLDKPCPNHAYYVKHALKDCGLIKKCLSGSQKKGEQKNKC